MTTSYRRTRIIGPDDITTSRSSPHPTPCPVCGHGLGRPGSGLVDLRGKPFRLGAPPPGPLPKRAKITFGE